MKTMSETPEEMPDNATDRPLVTFALIAYNQEKYIREAVEGAFSQTYEPLEIILSDDCSSDRTYEIMKSMADAYEGPHEVFVRQSPANRGIGCHINGVFALAKGDYFALAAGDDISEPDRIEDLIAVLSNLTSRGANPIQYSALTMLQTIDENGTVGPKTKIPSHGKRLPSKTLPISEFGLDELLEGRLFTSGPSRVFSRTLYETFGNLRDDCFTEDIIYLFRSVLAGNVLYFDKATVRYRLHSASLSQPKTLYAKPFEGVEAQLRADLETASMAGMITPESADRAEKWINDNVAFRNFYRARIAGHRPDLGDLLTILKARHLSTRRKFGILREFAGIR